MNDISLSATAPSDGAHEGTDEALAGGRLTIDLAALAANYRLLAGKAAPALAAGVVKADAYGLGAARVAPVLWREGCRTFFVALPQEGIALRAVLPEAEIFVLNGLVGPGAVTACRAHRLAPVLGSPEEMAAWTSSGDDAFALHVDTGMNRLGLSVEEAMAVADGKATTPALLMSHLASADDPDHPLNKAQWEAFKTVSNAFPGVRASLANSAGIFHGRDFAFDLVRPGIALYGGAPVNAVANPVQPVVTAEARIVRLRRAAASQTVSYGGTQTLARDTVIAVASAGYADGFHRSGSATGVPLRRAVENGGGGFLHGRRVPLLGRVTMDLTMFDVTDLGDKVRTGDWIELFGGNVTIDDAATAAGTISYELLTSLGRRYSRRYTGV